VIDTKSTIFSQPKTLSPLHEFRSGPLMIVVAVYITRWDQQQSSSSSSSSDELKESYGLMQQEEEEARGLNSTCFLNKEIVCG